MRYVPPKRRRNIPEDDVLHSLRSENLKFYIPGDMYIKYNDIFNSLNKRKERKKERRKEGRKEI
jgi:hypothetical protein